MKITKISRKKNGQYEVILSDKTSLSFYDDTIMKYNLLKPREIEDKELKEVVEYNNQIAAFNKALKYITTKLRTKKEVEKKLEEYDKTVIKNVISRLEKLGYLNEELYVKSFINDQINLTLTGPKKIVRKLVSLGFREEYVSNYLANYGYDVWQEKINKIITKKLKSNHNLSKLMLENKIKKDLILEGYNKEIIDQCLRNFDIKEDLNIIEKEFKKELNRLKKKFDGSALITKLKSNLYKKGFPLNEIEKLITTNIERN